MKTFIFLILTLLLIPYAHSTVISDKLIFLGVLFLQFSVGLYTLGSEQRLLDKD